MYSSWLCAAAVKEPRRHRAALAPSPPIAPYQQSQVCQRTRRLLADLAPAIGLVGKARGHAGVATAVADRRALVGVLKGIRRGQKQLLVLTPQDLDAQVDVSTRHCAGIPARGTSSATVRIAMPRDGQGH